MTRVAPPALRNNTRTNLGKGLGELPFVARLAVDLRFVVVWADHNLYKSVPSCKQKIVVHARERSGLKATPVSGPSESWWTSGADMLSVVGCEWFRSERRARERTLSVYYSVDVTKMKQAGWN